MYPVAADSERKEASIFLWGIRKSQYLFSPEKSVFYSSPSHIIYIQLIVLMNKQLTGPLRLKRNTENFLFIGKAN